MKTKPTFAARAGHWSAHHRKTAIGLWLVFVIGAVVAGQMAGLVKADESSGIGESAKAEQAIERGFPQDTVAESVIVQAPAGGRVTDPRVPGRDRRRRRPRVRAAASPGRAVPADAAATRASSRPTGARRSCSSTCAAPTRRRRRPSPPSSPP